MSKKDQDQKTIGLKNSQPVDSQDFRARNLSDPEDEGCEVVDFSDPSVIAQLKSYEKSIGAEERIRDVSEEEAIELGKAVEKEIKSRKKRAKK